MRMRWIVQIPDDASVVSRCPQKLRDEVARKGQENVELQRMVADLEQHQRATQQTQSDGDEVSRQTRNIGGQVAISVGGN